MHLRFHFIVIIGLMLLFAVGMSGRVWGQSGPGLILSPWEDEAVIDVDGSGLYEQGKGIETGGARFYLAWI